MVELELRHGHERNDDDELQHYHHHGRQLERRNPLMAGLLWAIIVILFIFWILGFALWHLGAIIHIVLVVAIILLIINLLTGRGARI